MDIRLGTWNVSLQDLLTIASLFIGVAGFLVAYFTLQWSRKETRLQSLSEVLGPLCRAMQHLTTANNHRRATDQIQRAFPDPEQAPDAVRHARARMAQYGEAMRAAYTECKTTEVELASRRFRFPDKVATLLKRALEELFEVARHVNEGSVEQADVTLAKLTSSYREVTEYARGWRLTDPFEGIRSRFKGRQKVQENEPRFELSEKDMDRVLALVTKRATDQANNTFVVHPPKKLVDNPGICDADDVIEQLEDSVFEVVFQDGTYAMLSLVELMVFTHNLILLQVQCDDLNKMFAASSFKGDANIEVKFSFAVNDLMRREVVKVLLSKIAFSDSPSDEAVEPRSAAAS